MNKPLLAGITGGIGAGKSTVSKIFEILSVPVYYADKRAKALLVENEVLIKKVKSVFGAESYTPDGNLNTKHLSNKVFGNTGQLELLNNLIHPEVAKDFETWIGQHSPNKYLIKEAALLYETGSYKHLDTTICVMAPKALRLERVLCRDPQRDKHQVTQIMNKQTADKIRKQLATHLIWNDNKKKIIPQVQKIHDIFLEISTQ